MHNRRRDEWNEAVRGAGLEHRTPDELERGRSALEAFDRAQNEAFGRKVGAVD